MSILRPLVKSGISNISNKLKSLRNKNTNPSLRIKKELTKVKQSVGRGFINTIKKFRTAKTNLRGKFFKKGK
jgi:hypothetical protein